MQCDHIRYLFLFWLIHGGVGDVFSEAEADESRRWDRSSSSNRVCDCTQNVRNRTKNEVKPASLPQENHHLVVEKSHQPSPKETPQTQEYSVYSGIRIEPSVAKNHMLDRMRDEHRRQWKS